MSLLDENFIDKDIIDELIIKYLKENTHYKHYDKIVIHKFFQFNEKIKKVYYDDAPQRWYIMHKYNTNEFYITKWIKSDFRLKYDLYCIKINKRTNYLTLDIVLNESA